MWSKKTVLKKSNKSSKPCKAIPDLQNCCNGERGSGKGDREKGIGDKGLGKGDWGKGSGKGDRG
ncbi:hypothetical protein BLD44_017860 [Mastigocladus laminosus UU774]|nr:hypothetical protein BLD44_017860 [Mastigocladus laminosus UU774]